MAVAVRCTGCRGASQVGVETLGMLVMCPMCREPFLALEEATPVVRSSARPTRSAPEPTPKQNRPRTVAEPVRDHTVGESHGSPLPTNGGLPVSVLFGFALLPLAIPLLWLIGPQLLSKPPALTLAAPISLAVAASVLCMAVVFTIDWTPMTRIKGVLILVGLSYFAGLSLYFLKREVVERVKDFFTPDIARWEPFEPGNSAYSVLLPKRPTAVPGIQPLGKGWMLSCHRCTTDVFPGPPLVYVVGSGPELKGGAEERWFDQVEQALLEPPLPPGTKHDPRTNAKLWQNLDAKRWVFEFPEGNVRVVYVLRSSGVVYYLSVEGEGLEPDSPAVKKFFDSFRVGPPPGK